MIHYISEKTSRYTPQNGLMPNNDANHLKSPLHKLILAVRAQGAEENRCALFCMNNGKGNFPDLKKD